MTLAAPTFVGFTVSPSHGAVVITNNLTSSPLWFVTLSSINDVSLDTADTICRQIGYTNAVQYSIMSLATSELLYDYDYDLSSMYVSSGLISF